MNNAKPAENAYPPAHAAAIAGMSLHMLNYLARQGYLVPTYYRGARGRTRYYSYRDLVIARIIQKLLNAGIEIARLKAGLKKLPRHSAWIAGDQIRALRMLATDGASLFFLEDQGTLLDLTKNGQLTFAFVLDVTAARDEVVQELPAEDRKRFTLRNHPIRFRATAGSSMRKK